MVFKQAFVTTSAEHSAWYVVLVANLQTETAVVPDRIGWFMWIQLDLKLEIAP